MAKHSSLIRPEVSPPLPVLMGSRRNSALKEASEWCQKHSRLHHREKDRSEILDEPVVAVHEDEAQEEEEINDDMSRFKRSIENWSTLTESSPLPIQPFLPTLCTIPEDAPELSEDDKLDKPSCIFSEDDILVHCFGCYDDEHFNMTPVPWRLQIWVRGSKDSIAVRGLHEQPILSGGILQTPMSPSKQCQCWMREHGLPASGFVGSAPFLVTHSLDTTVIWRLDRLWRVAEAAARATRGCKQDPPKPLDIRQTKESPSQLSECRAELWLKNSEGMYPVRRDEAEACFAIVGEYLPGRRHPGYRPDDFNGGVVLKIDSSGLLVLTVARGPDIHVYAISPNCLDVVPVSVVDVTFSLDSSLELVFPMECSRFRGLRARLESEPQSASSPSAEQDGQKPRKSKDSPARAKSRSATLASSEPRAAAKMHIEKHQVCTPRGGPHSTKIGTGSPSRPSPSREAWSRSSVLPASGRIQVPAIGVRAGYQRDARRPAFAVRIPDKQRPLASQGNSNSRTTACQCVRPASAPDAPVRACSNAPRGHRGEHPRKSTGPGPMASHGRSRPTGARSEPSASNLSGLSATSPTSHISPPKTVGRDVKVSSSQGARALCHQSSCKNSVDCCRRDMSKKLVETPSPQPATGVGTSRPSKCVPSRQTPHAVPAAPSVRVAGSCQSAVPVPVHVPRPMVRVSSSYMGHHFEQSRSSCFRVTATGHPATTGHSRMDSRSRCAVVR